MTPMKAFGVTSVLVGMPIRHATCTVTRKRLMDHRRGLFSSRARYDYQMPGGNYSRRPFKLLLRHGRCEYAMRISARDSISQLRDSLLEFHHVTAVLVAVARLRLDQCQQVIGHALL